MAKTSLKAGTTGYLARVFIQDSSKTDGSGLTGLTSGSVASWKIYTARDDDGNAGGVGVALQAGTRGTWSSGGFVEKDSVNMPGVYEIGIPNASLAAGSKTATLMLQGATHMAPLVLEFELTATDNQDGTAGGISRIDAAVTSRMATFTLPINFSALAIDGSGDVTYNNAAPPSTASIATAVFTTAMAEAYRANGATGTLAQLLYEILGNLVEANNSGTTRTVKKLDHSTTAATYTYDSATPNTITRAT